MPLTDAITDKQTNAPTEYAPTDYVSVTWSLTLLSAATNLPESILIGWLQAEDYGRLALYETEDLPYRRDAETFMTEYTEQRKIQHARMMANGNWRKQETVTDPWRGRRHIYGLQCLGVRPFRVVSRTIWLVGGQLKPISALLVHDSL